MLLSGTIALFTNTCKGIMYDGVVQSRRDRVLFNSLLAVCVVLCMQGKMTTQKVKYRISFSFDGIKSDCKSATVLGCKSNFT